jgi:hypothetical protein
MGTAMHRSLYGAALALALCGPAAAAPPASTPEGPGWTVYADGHGTIVDFPANLFPVAEGAPPIGNGRRFRTEDGRADVSIYTLPNEEHQTPRAYLSRHLKSDFKNLDYNRVSDRFFAVSGIVRGKTFYSRCNFEGRRGVMHCLYMDYPARETRAWDAVVTRMSLSLRGGNRNAAR